MTLTDADHRSPGAVHLPTLQELGRDLLYVSPLRRVTTICIILNITCIPQYPITTGDALLSGSTRILRYSESGPCPSRLHHPHLANILDIGRGKSGLTVLDVY